MDNKPTQDWLQTHMQMTDAEQVPVHFTEKLMVRWKEMEQLRKQQQRDKLLSLVFFGLAIGLSILCMYRTPDLKALIGGPSVLYDEEIQTLFQCLFVFVVLVLIHFIPRLRKGRQMQEVN